MFINFIHLRELNLKLDLEMSIVRYSGFNSESGAYIFAPSQTGKPMKLKPIDAYYMGSRI